MTRQHFLLALNVLLATVILAVLLGCGGDPEDPQAGSLAEKLCDGCGKWTSDPVAYTEMDQDGKMIEKSTRIKIDFSNWRQSGMSCSKPSGIGAPPNERSRISGFTYGDNTASSGHVHNGTHYQYIYQLDDQDPKVLYATWIVKDGKKELDRVRFTKDK